MYLAYRERNENETMKMKALTNIGMHRKNNEDSFCVGENKCGIFAVVADGMGGHLAGEVASAMAVEVLNERFESLDFKSEDELYDEIRKAYDDANRKIYEYAEANSKVLGMGTTAVCAFICKDKLFVANVGDSRAYIIDKDSIRQLSKDHSYVQQLVDSGVITPEEAKTHPKRNYITRAIGTEEEIEVDIFKTDYKDETVLLCSDGLCGLVSDDAILKIVNKEDDLEEIVNKLVEAANEEGGTDNITVALLKN